MASFIAQTAVNLPTLDLFSAFGKVSASTVTVLPNGFRIKLSATETVEVEGSFTYNASGVPISGTVTALQQLVSGTMIYRLSGISISWATALGYGQSRDAALAAWAGLLAGNDSLTGSSFADVLNGYGGADDIDGGAGVDTVVYTQETQSVSVALAGPSAVTVLVGGVATDTLRNVENVTGGAGNDTLIGDNRDNVLLGEGGDDTLQGRDGNDVLDGGAGSDTALYTDKTVAVTVTLNGAADAKVKVGGVDEDTLRNIENVTGGSGNDVLTGDLSANILDGGDGDDLLTGGGGKDVLRGGAGIDTAVYSEKTVAVAVTLKGADRAQVFVGGTPEDELYAIENVIGGTGNDVLSGDEFDNVLIGNAGDDTLAGRGGNDTLDGGPGIDVADYSEKVAPVVVTLNGSGSAIVRVGNVDEDTIRNIENLVGGGASDRLTGDVLANVLTGGQGDDILIGGDGDDTLIGQADKDTLDGGAGMDTVSYAEKPVGVVVTLKGSTDSIVQVGGADEDTIRNIEHVIGGLGADVLTGDDSDNRLSGGAGNDVLQGNKGADTLDGGASVDTAVYTEKTASITVALAGATEVRLFVNGVAEDTLKNIENITGGSGDDMLTGDALANALLGGAGNDTLTGGAGADLIDGGPGSDTVLFTDKTLPVVLTLNGAAPAAAVVVGVLEDTVQNVENVTGGSGTDILIGDSHANVLIGGGGDDILKGAGGADTLDGGAGIDTALFDDKTTSVVLTLNGSADAIAIINGVAEDTLRNVENVVSGSGNDTLTGDSQANGLSGGDGDDLLSGGLGDDRLMGGRGADTLDGGGGIDTAVYTGTAASVVVTLAGDETVMVRVGGVIEDRLRSIENLIGGEGDDQLTGDGGANWLAGGSGDDQLNGAAGDDILIGEAGADTLDGGAGIDTAVYADKTASVVVALRGAANAVATVGGVNEDTLRNIENVIGGLGDDALTGDALANLLDGGAGDDILTGLGGNDELDGGLGTDTASYAERSESVAVTLNVAVNATVFVNGIAEDTIRNIENVIGGAGDDTLIGDRLNNRLAGGAGDDVLQGAAGNDTLVGGAGSDTASYAEKLLSVRVVLNGAAAVGVVVGSLVEDTISEIENIVGSGLGDFLTGDDASNRLEGRGGDDLIAGLGGADSLDGGAGIDTVSYAEKTVAVRLTLRGAEVATVLAGDVAEDRIANFEDVIGGSADDVITGDAEANVIDGGAGNDLLDGGENDDVLIGGEGLDTLIGGAGFDVASYQEKTESVVVTLRRSANAIVKVNGVAEDTIRDIEGILGGSAADVLTGDELDNLFLGGGGRDTIDGGAGSDTADYSDKTLRVEVALAGADPVKVLVGGAEEDTIRRIENIIGGAGADILYGDDGNNMLSGGLGNDILRGGKGADWLDGGAGIDTVLYSDRTEDVSLTLNVGLAVGVMVGGVLEDMISAIENVVGGAGNDLLVGDSVANVLDGGAGNDTIRGAGGLDTLDGGAGIDTVLYTDQIAPVEVVLNGATYTTVRSNALGNIQPLDIIRNFENVIGGNAADTLTGDAADNLLAGGNGDDILAGGGGVDTLDGGAGLDTASFFDKTVSVRVTLAGTADAIAIVGGNDEDTLRGIENLIGGSAADTLTGDDGANVLDGGAGDDTLLSGAGDDVLIGGAGKDRLDGGQGIDTASYADKTASVVVTLAGGAEAEASVGGTAEDRLIRIENLIGGSAADRLTGDALANTVRGGGGADTLDGGAGLDTVDYSDKTASVVLTLAGSSEVVVRVGGADEDRIRNFENVTGGSGADSLTGDGLANVLSGGAGNDTLTGGGGADTIDGGLGIDTVSFADKTAAVTLALNDTLDAVALVGGVAEDTIRNVENVIGGSGNDRLTGDRAANVLFGGDGDDILMGGLGADRLEGGNGIDTADYSDKTLSVSLTLNGAADALQRLAGGAEDTVTGIENLIGGAGADVLIGDAGANTFRGGLGNDILDGGGGIDTVLYTDKTQAIAVTLAGAVYATVTVNGQVEDTIRNFENVVGGDGDDTIIGDGFANVLMGGAGDDTLGGGGGDDLLDGGTGINTAVFTGASAQYSISYGASETRVFGPEGTDTLRNIQYLQFSDITMPTSSGSEFAITAVTAAKNEGNAATTPVAFTVTRVGNLTKAQTVKWTTRGVTEPGTKPAVGADFAGGVMPQGVLTFAVGEFRKTIVVDVVGDRDGESDDAFSVTLSSPTAGASITTATASSIIRNDDTSLSINALPSTTTEGDSKRSQIGFRIVRAGDLTGTTSVNWAAVPGQADAADFYGGVLPTGSVTFAAGETLKVIAVGIAGDTLVEPDEPFAVVLYGASPGASITTMTAYGTIVNDDAIPNSPGNDTLIGTLGSDLFILTGGNDTVIGGAGIDRFQFLPAALGDAATQTVSLPDFDRSLGEVLDLTRVDAIAATAADDPFRWIGQAGFSGAPGELRWSDTGGGVLIEGDSNGDGVADLSILAGTPGPVGIDWFRL